MTNSKPAEVSLLSADMARAFEVKEMPKDGANSKHEPHFVQAQQTEPEEKPRKHGRHHRKKKEHHEEVVVAKPIVKVPDEVEGIAGPGNMNFAIPNRRSSPDPVWVGEKVWMDVTWLNTKAGEFELEVLPFKNMNGRKVYDFKGSARTSDLFSFVYKAEDTVESFVDFEGWFPYKFVLHGEETKHIRNNLELFDHGAKKQYVASYDNRIQKGEIVQDKGIKDLTPLSQDSLSAIYYVRTLKFEEGQVLRFPMSTNGRQWETVVSVLGREEVQTKMGYMKSFKCKIETRFNGALQQQGDAFMWFSDDDRKFLLRFEAKVRIGWVAGVTKRIEPGVPEQPLEIGPAAKDDGKKSTSQSSVKGAVGPMGFSSEPQSAPHPVHEQHGRHRTWFRKLLESLGEKD